MKIEIDQSGRIEETNRDTVIAIANKDMQFSLRIPGKVKRAIKAVFKKQNRPRLFPIRTFAVSVGLLIRKSKLKPQILVLDIEYPGHESVITEIVKEILGRNLSVHFAKIGKNSPAHIKAYFTYKKNLKKII